MKDVIKFINFSLKVDTSKFNGRLINIKDNINKILKNKIQLFKIEESWMNIFFIGMGYMGTERLKNVISLKRNII